MRATGWEVLYELSWAPLARSIVEKMKAAHLLVLTPEGMALRSPEVMDKLFGSEVMEPDHRNWLFRQSINETGLAVLDRLLETSDPDAETLRELYASFAILPNTQDVESRLGIEKITASLLDQRFREDLDAIAGLPRTEVI